jgi:hypothetical protein
VDELQPLFFLRGNMYFRKSYFALLCILFLSGCMSIPSVDQSRVVKSSHIVVATPNATFYATGRGASADTMNQRTIGIGLGGLIASVILNAAASSDEEKAVDFNSYIKTTIDNSNINKELMDLIKEDLEKMGYKISEQNFYLPDSNPKMAIKDREPTLVGDVLPGADIIVVPWIYTAYMYPSPILSYRRGIVVKLFFFDAKDNQLFGRRFITYREDGEDYRYGSFEKLKENAPEAFDGLRQALLSLRPEVINVFKKEPAVFGDATSTDGK